MSKNPWGQIGDEFGEIIGQTAKTTANVAQSATIGVIKKLGDELTGSNLSQGDKGIEKIEQGQSKQQNFTALDKDKLKNIENGYKKQDDMQLEQLRNRLFNIVKSDEKQAYEEAKQEEQERLRKIEEEEMQKNQREQEGLGELPQMTSKTKRGMTAQKAVKSSNTETKANTGKQ
ncbi:MAG TPA: hypothetical protein VK338_05045 [Candidatus Nitrosocosmicus sp.]|nr:hypothetical protein [Candidatus Nitrosocosmicus sp.]